MMNDNDFNAIFNPRDADPHHIAAQKDDEPTFRADIAIGVAFGLAFWVFIWWLS